jgi:hypothetical protein
MARPQARGIVREAARLATAARLRLMIERSASLVDDDPVRLPPGLSVLISPGLCSDIGAVFDCLRYSTRPLFSAVSIHLQSATDPPRNLVHNVGHAFGLQHLTLRLHSFAPGFAPSAFAHDVPVMGSGVSDGRSGLAPRAEFSTTELDAVRSVYAAGLGPGSTRADFAARGLVRP